MTESRRHEIKVVPKATYVAEQSDPSKNQYVFSYTITITNTGDVPAQLISRHWYITDGEHRVQEVKGLGVIGQQPVLKPGESFEYTSGVPLPTPSGFMTGSYGMVSASGEPFDIAIPTFSLDSPEGQRTLN